MPQSPTAKKALRQNIKRRLVNRTQRSALRTVVKKVRTAISAGDIPAARAAASQAFKKLDQSAAKDLIHKNTASRLKSRIAKAIKAADLAAAGK